MHKLILAVIVFLSGSHTTHAEPLTDCRPEAITRFSQSALDATLTARRGEKEQILTSAVLKIRDICQAEQGWDNDPHEGVWGRITDGHYLEPSTKTCSWSYVGAGSRVMILDPTVYKVGNYSKAVHVRVISNTDTSSVSAPVGCEGHALNGYLNR